MKIMLKNMLCIAVLLSISCSIFAAPAQLKTIEQFFEVSQIKTTLLNTFTQEDLAEIGVTEQMLWEKLEPELKSIYAEHATEEELLATLRYYQDPEVASLLKKMPEIGRLSEQTTSRILMSHVLGKAFQNP